MTMKNDDVTNQELLIGELTAALAAESMTAQDALPITMAQRAIAAGEVIVPLKPSVTAYDRVVVPPPVISAPTVRSRRPIAMWSGWLAAAAMLALWLRAPGDAGTVNEATAPVPVVATASSLASNMRDSLIIADRALTRIAWAPTTDSTALGAGGDVVWSNAAQRGVMHLVGLKANDTRRWQYQLWIFDKTRDQRYPVDGGVFDVPPGATEVFVPINARVPVGDAVMFAVTVEAPGGVVVSTRERVALLASL